MLKEPKPIEMPIILPPDHTSISNMPIKPIPNHVKIDPVTDVTL